MSGPSGAIFWIAIFVILFIIESSTVQMVCIWFAFGALFAMMASFIGAELWLQLLIFLLTSMGILIVARPFFMSKLRRNKIPTNVDRIIGQIGIVIEQVDNFKQKGRVRAYDLDWTARSEHGDILPIDSMVIVKYIDGVKLIVEEYIVAVPEQQILEEIK